MSPKDACAPVVHIRIIRDKDVKEFPCNYCLKAFTSADLLSQHESSQHASIDIQEIFVCPICRCCLLCQDDMLDHLTLTHEMIIKGRESSICEYCGICASNEASLMKHQEVDHNFDSNEILENKSTRTELTLGDLSLMGVGNPKCKTVFDIIEYSLEGTEAWIPTKNKKVTEIGNSHGDEVHLELATLPLQPSNSNMKNMQVCEISNNIEERQDDRSQIEMVICCDTGSEDMSSTSMSAGEIILTVESEEELVWSNDIMSQVISSSGILTNSFELPGIEPHGDPKKQKSLIVSTGAGRKRRKKICSVCGIVFRQLSELEEHENAAHGIRVKCDLCNDTFVFSKSLNNHRLRKHSNESNFHCNVCDKSFKCRSNLWSHYLTHTSREARRFSCPECPQRFHNKSKMNVHLQSHTGEKKFQCGECHKGFVYQSLLLRHMRKHFPEAGNFLSDDQTIYMVEVGTEKLDDESNS